MKRKQNSLGWLLAAITMHFVFLFFSCKKVEIGEGFNWPRWGGPNGNWISEETQWDPYSLDGKPEIAWKTNVGYGYSNVVIYEGHLFTIGQVKGENVVYCLNAKSGEKIWKSSFVNSEVPQATAAVDKTSVYVLAKDGTLVCLDAKSGKISWKKNIVAGYGAVRPHYGFAGSPVIENDIIVLTSNTAGMAVGCEAGQLIWSSQKPPGSFPMASPGTGVDFTTPVVYSRHGQEYAILSSWKGISAVNVRNGEVSWLYEWDFYGPLSVDPVLIDGRVFINCEMNKRTMRWQSILLDIEGKDPKVIWKSTDIFSDISTPVIIDSYIYACQGGPADSPSTSLRCLSVDTARVMWDKKLDGVGSNGSISMMAADGKLLILTEQGILYAAEASPEGFKELSRCDVLKNEKVVKQFWVPPILCNGRIYCRNYNGELICIDVAIK